jgi:hypothetical protein
MFLFLNVSKFILSGMEEVGIEHENATLLSSFCQDVFIKRDLMKMRVLWQKLNKRLI